jgi:hypothetical protein
MYKALIQLDIPVDSNKMIWKMKIPLKPKFLGGIFVEGWSLPKTILLNEVGMGVKYVFFVIIMRLIKNSFSHAISPGLYGQSSK